MQHKMLAVVGTRKAHAITVIIAFSMVSFCFVYLAGAGKSDFVIDDYLHPCYAIGTGRRNDCIESRAKV